MESISIKNEQSISNESALMRAAEISSLISSLTLGPNAIQNQESEETTEKLNSQNGHNSDKIRKTSNTSPISRSNRLDINDVKTFQQQMLQQNVSKKIDNEVRKKLELKRLEEIEKHKEIRRNLQAMKEEAERQHKLKMEEFDRQVQAELELERQREQAYQEQRKQLAANTLKIQEEKEKILREQIRKWEETFTRQDTILSKMLTSCAQEFGELETYKKELKNLQNLRDSNKSNLDGIKNVCIKLDKLIQNFQKDLSEFIKAQNEMQEKKAAAEASALQKQQEVITPIQIATVTPQSQDKIDHLPVVSTNPLQSELFRQYNDYNQLLTMKKAQTRFLDEAPELQQIRFALKYAINNSVNLLNEKNKTTLLDGYQKLFNLLSGQRINTPKGNVSISDHNEAADWCKIKIAEKLIDRCDKESSIVFYSAAIAVALWKKFPDFGEIFKASLYKECPFLLPYKPTKLSSQSNEEFLLSWGFRLNNGVCESHAHYEGRVSKFAALLGAIWITYPRNGEVDTSFNISNGWRYFATVLNSSPDTSYLNIIGKLLEIAGFHMHKTYGIQFVKLMVIIKDKYLPLVHPLVDEETSASFNRLRDSVASFFQSKQFPTPNGFLTPGYW